LTLRPHNLKEAATMSSLQSTRFERTADDPPIMPDEPADDVRAWNRATLRTSDWHIGIDDACRGEIVKAVEQLRNNPLETLLLNGRSFDMPACKALMMRVKAKLDQGPLFVVLDRLPLGEMSKDEARQLYWILCSLMSQPVAQRFNGLMSFDVLDRKVAVLPGSGIRPTVTNTDLTFHNDNSYNSPQPDYIALLCLGTPVSGGTSKVASVRSVHRLLSAHYPRALSRLYRPFWYDRYREHREGEPSISRFPVFAWDGEQLTARIAIPEIRAGYKLASEEMDAETAEAIGALERIFAMPELAAEFQLEQGQIQIANNRHALHSRTDFTDSEDESNRRHLVRLWLRNEGSRSYTGKGVA
jgi:alpha-ketoglutarate-dependent taurine dioxygenase